MATPSLRATIFAALLLLLTQASIAHASDLKVLSPWVSMPLLEGEPAYAYFGMQNNGRESRTMVGASSPRAERIELQRSVFEDGTETTKPVTEWEVPKDGAVSFAPGGIFLVLFGPKNLQEGEKIEIEIRLADGEKVRMDAVVKDE